MGRGSDVELRVEDDRVSRKHLRLVPGREGWLVEDLNSSNGTFFRGQRIHTLQVEGPTRLVLADARSGVPIELEPSPGLDRHPAVPPPQAAPEGRKATALRVRTTHGEFTIVGADTITIGRDIQNTLRLEDPHVSRFHATLRQDDEGWKLLDIGSSNGTYHNGQRIEQVTVTDATSVRFGDARHGPQVWLEPATAPGGTAAQASPGLDLGTMTSVHLSTGRIRIGRSADNDIVVSDLNASRHHAELIGNPETGYELIDLGSHNGTFVNGRRIGRQLVTEKDLIAIGRHVCRLRDGSLELFAQQGEIGFDVVGLAVRAGNKTLLHDVSFSLPKRSLLAAVGPSGAGKSTLLGALNGLRPAHEGHVYYGGRDLYLAYDELRHRIGYVPQDDILHPTLTVRRALMYSAELRFGPDVSRAERDRRVEEVMEELDLSERADLQVNRLSGGQRKRVSIAMELLTRPNILFLDEPTSGLDPGMEKHVMELLRQLANGDRTVIVVTHSVQSLHVCDRLLFLAHGGQVAFYGPPQEALGFFDHDNFADVFTDLQSTELRDWRQKLGEKGIYERYIRRPLAEREIQSQGLQAAESEGVLKPQRRWRQFRTLTRRYLELIASDPVNLLLLSCQAPLLAVIVLLATGSNGFDTSNSSALNTALLSALLIAVSATYLGASNSIREIVKEQPLYSRERAIGLSIASYIASKVAVLSIITIIQGIVLVLIGTIRQGGPSGGVVLPWLRLELIVGMALTGMGAMGIGLMFSALVSKADKALTLLPLVLVPQLILAYPNLKVQDKPVLNQLSYVAPTQWGYAAFASSIHFNQIIYMKAASLDPTISRVTDADTASSAVIKQVDSRTDLSLLQRWNHQPQAWLTDIAAMLGLLVLEVTATGLILRRRDPELLRRGSRRLRARRARIAKRSAPSRAG